MTRDGGRKPAPELERALREAAPVFAQAVRPPTVPKGSSRLRVTLSSDHTDAEVARMLDSLAKLGATK